MRVAVFNTKAELHFVDLPKTKGDDDKLSQLQKLVDGSIEYVPKILHEDNKLIAFANEEGMNKELPGNYVGSNALVKLGFYAGDFCTLFGNLVVMKDGEKSLTKKQEELIRKAYEDALLEYGDDEEEKEEEEEEVREPSPKKLKE